MFSDIEGSSGLTEELGVRRWLALLGRHNEIVRRSLVNHDGFEVKSQGDGFMIAFASGRNAINCALSIQQDLAKHRALHPDDALHVRIGLHTGEVIREREDFFGKNVILAARIASHASGDGILVSSLLRELVASAGVFVFGPVRKVELKGLTGTHRVYEVPWASATAVQDGGSTHEGSAQ